MESLYQPAEDSFLLWKVAREFLEKNSFPGMKILDMGTGSGFLIKKVADFLTKRKIKAELRASDRIKVKLPDIHFILSNLFQNIPEKFDLILFNPPYLPAGEKDHYLGAEKKNLIGGEKGSEVALKFLDQLPKHLEAKGTCFLVTNNLSHPEEIEKKAQEQEFLIKKVAQEAFDFEKIFVYLIRRK